MLSETQETYKGFYAITTEPDKWEHMVNYSNMII